MSVYLANSKPFKVRPPLNSGRLGQCETTQRDKCVSELVAAQAAAAPNATALVTGNGSLLAVRLFSQVEKRFGCRWPLATLFQAPTIAQLAATIEKERSPKGCSLVAIKPDGSRPPFFCVHGLGGNVVEFSDLARHLGDDQPFYGLQSQGLNGKEPPLESVEDMAAHYIKEMRAVQTVGPYFIGGRSLGGNIAFEMAHQLRAEGQKIALLALLDTYPTRSARLSERLASHAHNLKRSSFRERVDYLAYKTRFVPRKVKSRIWRRIHALFQWLGRPLPRALSSVKGIQLTRGAALFSPSL